MNWYCIHTKPKKEGLVEHYLTQELGLETYFPRLKRWKTIRRVKREVIEPLFPRYLFCKLSLADNYRSVTYGRDVINVVSTGDRPAMVRNETIQQLKDWAGIDETVITIEPEPIREGDRIKINEGPMMGLEAIFLHETSHQERVAILLDMMNSEARVEISKEQIERVTD